MLSGDHTRSACIKTSSALLSFHSPASSQLLRPNTSDAINISVPSKLRLRATPTPLPSSNFPHLLIPRTTATWETPTTAVPHPQSQQQLLSQPNKLHLPPHPLLAQPTAASATATPETQPGTQPTQTSLPSSRPNRQPSTKT